MTTEKNACSTLGKWTIIAVVLVLAVGVLSWATMEQRKSIAQTLTGLGECSTFAECVDKAGLSGILEKTARSRFLSRITRRFNHNLVIRRPSSLN